MVDFTVRSLKILVFFVFINYVSGAEDQIANFVNPDVVTVKDYVEWPLGKIPFYIETQQFDQEQNAIIMSALANVSAATCLKFDLVAAAPEPDQHVLHFLNPNGAVQCVVDLSTHVKGGPHKIHLGYGCMTAPDIYMVIMRALGFTYEHNRPIRDKYIQVLMENVHPDAKELFTMGVYEPKELAALPYDKNSVLHFGERYFSSNGHKTIIFKNNTSCPQTRKGLTPLDLKKINIVYYPECVDRLRKEKIEDCQNRGIPRVKREASDFYRSLRVNPDITPPPAIVRRADENGLTYTDALVKELEIEKEVEEMVQKANDLAFVALNKARAHLCNETQPKSIEKEDVVKPEDNIFDIVGNIAEYVHNLVMKAKLNLTTFCLQSQFVKYEKNACLYSDPLRCLQNYQPSDVSRNQNGSAEINFRATDEAKLEKSNDTVQASANSTQDILASISPSTESSTNASKASPEDVSKHVIAKRETTSELTNQEPTVKKLRKPSKGNKPAGSPSANKPRRVLKYERGVKERVWDNSGISSERRSLGDDTRRSRHHNNKKHSDVDSASKADSGAESEEKTDGAAKGEEEAFIKPAKKGRNTDEEDATKHENTKWSKVKASKHIRNKEKVKEAAESSGDEKIRFASVSSNEEEKETQVKKKRPIKKIAAERAPTSEEVPHPVSSQASGAEENSVKENIKRDNTDDRDKENNDEEVSNDESEPKTPKHKLTKVHREYGDREVSNDESEPQTPKHKLTKVHREYGDREVSNDESEPQTPKHKLTKVHREYDDKEVSNDKSEPQTPKHKLTKVHREYDDREVSNDKSEPETPKHKLTKVHKEYDEREVSNDESETQKPKHKLTKVHREYDNREVSNDESEPPTPKPKPPPVVKSKANKEYDDKEVSGDDSETQISRHGIPPVVKLSKANREFYDDRKWPDGIVRYIIKDPEDYDMKDVRSRLAAVNDILVQRTCVRIQEVTQSEITEEEIEDYLVLDNSPDFVTGKVGGKQLFGVVELLEGGQHRQHTAMMVMAMLGFYFEVARHDRDQYIRVHPRHIRPDKLHHFEKIRDAATFPLPYDYKSATHPPWQFWRQLGRTGISSVATYKSLDPDGSIMKSLGQNYQLLSDQDIIKINTIYGVECFKKKNMA